MRTDYSDWVTAILLDGAQCTGIVLIFNLFWVIEPFILVSGEIAVVEV